MTSAMFQRRDQRTSRHGRRSLVRGFTLIELIVVIAIIGVLAVLVVPRVVGRIGTSRTAVAQANAKSLANQFKIFLADHGDVIAGESLTIDCLWECPPMVDASSYQPYVDNADDLLDPWNNKYELRRPGTKNVDFDIVSYGSDGKPGGDGEAVDVIAP